MKSDRVSTIGEVCTRRAVKFPLNDKDFGCELAGSGIGAEEVNKLYPYGLHIGRMRVKNSYHTPSLLFRRLWQSLNGSASWEWGLSLRRGTP